MNPVLRVVKEGHYEPAVEQRLSGCGEAGLVRPDRISADLPPALVLGSGVHGLAVIRSLGRRGIRVEVASSESDDYDRFSRYCSCYYPVQSLDDSSLVDFLLDSGRRAGRKRALFITRDKSVPWISQARADLEKFYYFNLADDDTLQRLMDKERLFEFLSEAAGSAPLTVGINGVHGLERAAARVGFPCVLKPALRTYGFKAVVVPSLAALEQAYREARRHTDRVILQQWVDGRASDIYFCFVYIDGRGEMKARFVGRKLRQLPNDTGIATAMEGCEDAFVLKESIRLMKHAGYRGFGSTEFKRDRATGRYQFIEFTVGRTDYNVETAVANGVDLPYIGYCDLVGNRPDGNIPAPSKAIRWIDMDRDVRAMLAECRRGDYGRGAMIKKMLQNLGSKRVFSIFASDDLKPFFAYLLNQKPGLRRRLGKAAGFGVKERT